MKEIKKVSIIGLGAIGSFFASRLKSAADVTVVAGGERGEKLKKDGLIINGSQEYFNVVSPEDNSDKADLVIIITKMTGLKDALEDIKNQVDEHTIIMSPLNGVESEDVVKSVFGDKNVLYSLVRISSVKKGNVVNFEPNVAIVEFGDVKNESDNLSENVKAVRALFEKAGVTYKIQPDMIKAEWEKFICNVSENQVTAVLDIPFGAWRSSKEANDLRINTAREVIEVAEKKGIELDPDYAVKHLEFLNKFPSESKTSMHQDILAGRHTEKDMLSGAMIRFGKETGVPTPYNEFLYNALCVLEQKNDGKIVGAEKYRAH